MHTSEKTVDLSPGKEPSERISNCSIWQSAKVRTVPVPSGKLKNFTIMWHWVGYLERYCLSSAGIISPEVNTVTNIQKIN